MAQQPRPRPPEYPVPTEVALAFERSRLKDQLKSTHAQFEKVNLEYEAVSERLEQEVSHRQRDLREAARTTRSAATKAGGAAAAEQARPAIESFLTLQLGSALQGWAMLYRRRMGGLTQCKELVERMEEIDEELEAKEKERVFSLKQPAKRAAELIEQEQQAVDAALKADLEELATQSTRGWCARLFGYV